MTWREELHPRDAEGQFTDTPGGGWVQTISDQIGHGLGQRQQPWIVRDTIRTRNGDIDLQATSGGQIKITYPGNHTIISTNTAYELQRHLEFEQNPDEGMDIGQTQAVYTYPPDPTGRSLPKGYAHIKRTGADTYELELLDTSTPIEVNRAEMARIGQGLQPMLTAYRVPTTDGGSVDTGLTPDEKHARVRIYNPSGEQTADLKLTETDWTRAFDALNVVWEGFDETSKFGHDPEEDLDSLEFDTSLGRLRARRIGPVLSGVNQPGVSLVLESVDGRWSITVPATVHMGSEAPPDIWGAKDLIDLAWGA